MLRAEIKSEGSTYVIDRYIEIYKNCSVQYTIKSNHTGSEDEVLAGIIKSFCFDSKAYSNRNNSGNNDSNNTSDTLEYKDFSSISNDKIGISMSVPADLQMQEIPIVYTARATILFCLLHIRTAMLRGLPYMMQMIL